jgi:hypothetical protein
MSSGTSTEPQPFTAGHFYVLLSMVAATAAVVVARDTHPAALLLLSGATLAAGYTAWALHKALLGLLSRDHSEVLDDRTRAVLESDKATVLRAIKELEFDYGMKKVAEADYQEMMARLKNRALLIMEQLEQLPEAPTTAAAGLAQGRSTAPCPKCQTANAVDAKFCNQCGERIGSVHA